MNRTAWLISILSFGLCALTERIPDCQLDGHRNIDNLPSKLHHLHIHQYANANCAADENKVGLRLTCFSGIEEAWLQGANCDVRILELVEWPREDLSPTAIAHLFPAVHKLVIRNSTLLQTFSDDFPPFDELKHINFNGLPNITLQRELFSRLTALETLDLRGNRIEVVHPDFISSPPNLHHLYLVGNRWNCSNENLQWLARLNTTSRVLAKSRMTDYANLTCQGYMYPGKPLPVVMDIIRILNAECPENCTCQLTNLVRQPGTENLVPLSTIDCRFKGLRHLPSKIPSITTNLLLHGNNISDLRPLAQNNTYKKVTNIYFDDNQLTSVAPLEGSEWILTFSTLSLRGNNISQVPTYAFEHAFENNKNIIKVFLGNNPWQCNCQFTPSFQELLLKYKSIVGDLHDIKCAESDHEQLSRVPVNALSRSTICIQQSEENLQTVDIINILLASLICLVVGKFCYDYYYFKKTGNLPWISSKIP